MRNLTRKEIEEKIAAHTDLFNKHKKIMYEQLAAIAMFTMILKAINKKENE